LFKLSAPGGDLQTLMDDDMVPYERDAVKFVRQVLEGLLFLHERNMAHLDIKVKIPSTLEFHSYMFPK
jgi:serine/threonine protein kinase